MSGQPTLGRILRDLRNHRGWTLKEMSERSGAAFDQKRVSNRHGSNVHFLLTLWIASVLPVNHPT